MLLLQSGTAPQVIRDKALSRLWYKLDDKFLLPKAFINMEFTRYTTVRASQWL